MKDFSDLEKDLARELNQLRDFYENDLPRKAVVELEALTDQSFRKEEYQGHNKKKWPKRKKEDKEKSRRNLLVKSAELIRSTEAEIQNGAEITVSIGSDKVYAQIHNEGLTGRAFGKHPFQMPQRQFMPIPGEEEPVISDKLEKYIDQNLDRIFEA